MQGMGSLNDSQGSKFDSKQKDTNGFKKIRVESFAKTPFFLKSPRSLTSSCHYTKEQPEGIMRMRS